METKKLLTKARNCICLSLLLVSACTESDSVKKNSFNSSEYKSISYTEKDAGYANDDDTVVSEILVILSNGKTGPYRIINDQYQYSLVLHKKNKSEEVIEVYSSGDQYFYTYNNDIYGLDKEYAQKLEDAIERMMRSSRGE